MISIQFDFLQSDFNMKIFGQNEKELSEIIFFNHHEKHVLIFYNFENSDVTSILKTHRCLYQSLKKTSMEKHR